MEQWEDAAMMLMRAVAARTCSNPECLIEPSPDIRRMAVAMGIPPLCGSCLDSLSETEATKMVLERCYGPPIEDADVVAVIAKGDQVMAAVESGEQLDIRPLTNRRPRFPWGGFHT